MSQTAWKSSENYREYRTVDKSAWGRGAWDGEPDKVQWIDPTTGLDCLIVRGPSGALCGYVGVDDSHPWHGKEYSASEIDVSVHGGLTFSDPCAETGDESAHVCHVAAPGRADHVWWFGFDCAHAWDVSPKYDRQMRGWEASYKEIGYVRQQVEHLAAQIHAARSA